MPPGMEHMQYDFPTAVTDSSGNFTLNNVPVPRVFITVQCNNEKVLYEPFYMPVGTLNAGITKTLDPIQLTPIFVREP